MICRVIFFSSKWDKLTICSYNCSRFMCYLFGTNKTDTLPNHCHDDQTITGTRPALPVPIFILSMP